MSRQAAQLPPRCPFQKKSISRPSTGNGCEAYHKPYSVLDEQAAWVDDLLSDSKGSFYGRAASDSGTVWDSFSVDNGSGVGLESNCMYGPNSPRRKGNLSFSEKAIVSALAESVSEEAVQYSDGGLPFPGMDSKGPACDELDTETKLAKRHAGQRSRVRKLQYIAELEKNVNVFERVESELSNRIACLVQQRVALSLENSKLKQQVARVQHQKLIMEGEYQFLKREALRLKTALSNSPKTRYSTSAAGHMAKLHLNLN